MFTRNRRKPVIFPRKNSGSSGLYLMDKMLGRRCDDLGGSGRAYCRRILVETAL